MANPPAPDVEAIAALAAWDEEALDSHDNELRREYLRETLSALSALTAHTTSLQARVEELERQVQSAEGVISTFQRANNLYREAMDERTTFKNQARAAESEANRMREALEIIAEGHDVGRHDGLPEDGPAHDADTMFALARAALRPADEPVTQREM